MPAGDLRNWRFSRLRLRSAVTAMLALCCVVGAALSGEARGSENSMRSGRVIDGDGFELIRLDGEGRPLGRTNVRIAGINAPEKRQRCGNAQAQPCGVLATTALESLLATGDLKCQWLGQSFQRDVMTCRIGAADLGSEMVRRGWACDFNRPRNGGYAAAQADAERDGLGFWALGLICLDGRPTSGGRPATTPVAESGRDPCGRRLTCAAFGSDCARCCEYFLRCSAKHLDADGDGIPCERRTCKAPCIASP